MIFDKSSLSFALLDVLEISQKNVDIYNTARPFHALSFRYVADTYMKTKSDAIHLGNSSICLVPANLEYERIAAVDQLIVIHMTLHDYFTNSIEAFTPNNPEKLASLFREILNCWNNKELGYNHRCSSILYEIFSECYIENHKETKEESKIIRSVEYLNQNYKNPGLRIGDAAKESYISEVYFRKLFKHSLGQSPQQYIITLRIQNAISLMHAGYYSLQEIAVLSGYTDYKYFAVEFKKMTKLTPSEYFSKVQMGDPRV